MASGGDLPRKRSKRLEVLLRAGRDAAHQAASGKAEELREREEAHAASESQPPEELVADARIREREVELIAQFEQARAEEAAFEERFGMTFEEFQARFDPHADHDLSEDYLAWSRAAERMRMLRYEIERRADRRSRRGRERPAPPEDPPPAGEGRPRQRVS
jgi:hypothetical protein